MIISIVEQLVTQLNVSSVTYGFGHGPQHWANLVNDEFDFGEFKGTCFLDQPITTEYQLTAGGYIGEFYNITIFFMLKSELDWTPEEHDEFCIEPANNAIRQFIAILQNANDIIDEVSSPTSLEFINLLDVNVSGKSLTIKLKPRINASVCTGAIPLFCKNAIITDSDGVSTFEVASGQTGTCTPFAPLNISNSNDSYDVDTSVDLELPDIDFTDSDGTTTSVPSMEDLVCTPVVSPSGIAYAPPKLSGQTVSYELYDDGWNLANGVYDYTPPVYPVSYAKQDVNAVSPFTTLESLNIDGTFDRFTDENGTQTYTNKVFKDHLTGRMYYYNWGGTGTDTFANHVANANAFSFLGFSDWRLTNIEELLCLFNFNTSEVVSNLINYPPMLIGNVALISSTTNPYSTTNTIRILGNIPRIDARAKTSTNFAIYVRNF